MSINEQSNIDINKEEEEEEDVYIMKRKASGVGTLLEQIQNDASNFEKKDEEESSKDVEYLKKVCDLYPKNNDPYYCQDCDLPCNSEFMYQQHISGARHFKRLKQKRRMETSSQVNNPYRCTENEEDATSGNSKRKKRKIDTNFRSILSETEEPVLGLHYVDEIFPETDSFSYDPMYVCNLCGVTAQKDPMISHIVGLKHMNKHFEMKFGWRANDKEEARQSAMETEQQEGGRRVDLIKTIYCDKLYPFQGKISKIESIVKNTSQNQSPNQESSITTTGIASLLKSITECEVKSQEDAKMAHDVAGSLIKALVKYKAQTVDVKHCDMLNAGCQNLLQSLETIYNIPSTIRSARPSTKESSY